MDNIKLNYHRFGDTVEAGDILLRVEVDAMEAKKGTQQVEKSLATLDKSVDTAASKLEKLPKTATGAFNRISTSVKSLSDANKTLDKLASKLSKGKFASSDFSSKYAGANNKQIAKNAAFDLKYGNDKSPDAALKKYQIEASGVATKQKLITDEINKQKAAADAVTASGKKQNEILDSISQKTQETASKEESAQQQRAAALAQMQSFYQSYTTVAGSDVLTNKLKEETNAILEKLDPEQREVAIKKLMTSENETYINSVVREIQQLKQSNSEMNNSVTAFTRLKDTINTMHSAISSVSKGVSGFINKIKSMSVTWRIISGTVSGIISTFANLYDTAASYEESLNLYTVALGEYAEAGSEWANKIADALYLDPSQIMQYTGALYSLVEGLGVSSKAAYTMSTNLTQLAYDMSSYLNIDVESAYTKLQSAMTGQSRAVASAGIAMQQASLQELAYSMGIKKTVSDMTQAEKTYLRYIQIMRSTSNMQGDLARTIITPENALRVVKQQFTLLARAIGQVFIPIVLTAIPYVMALTQALKELASWLGAKLGYKVADIDYSGLKSLDTGVENVGNTADSTSKKLSGVGKASKDLSKMLAPFDDLNVVQSETSSSGSGSGTSGTGSTGDILSGLEKYVDGYDMLKNLNDQLSGKVEDAKGKLKDFAKVLETIGLIWAGWKLLKLADSLIKFAEATKKAWVEGTGLAGLLGKLTRNFTDGYKYAQLFGENGLSAVLSGFRNVLGPVGKFNLSLLNVIGSFTSGLGIMSSWDGSLGDFAAKLGITATAVGLLTTGSYLFVGATAAVATGIAGAIGAFAGISVAIENYQKSLTAQERYDHLFDGMGVSVGYVKQSFGELSTEIVNYGNSLSELGGNVDTAKESLDKTYDSLQTVHDLIVTEDYSSAKDVISQLTSATDNYKASVDENKNAHISYHETVLKHLLEEGTITKKEYDEQLASAKQYYTWLALNQSDYADRLAKLDAQLANGSITQEQYNTELQKLNDEYLGIVDPIDDAASSLGNMYYTAASKIDLKNPESIKDLVEDLKTKYDESSKSIETQKQTVTDKYETERDEINETLGSLQAKIDKGEELSKKEKETYEIQNKRLSEIETEYKQNMESINTSAETLGGTYKNYLATIYGQISEAGKLSDSDVKESVNTIKTEMSSLTSFDTSKSVNDLFGNLTDDMNTNGKTFETGTIGKFKEWGITFSDEYSNSLKSGMESHKTDAENSLKSSMSKYPDITKAAGQETGKQLDAGISKGIKDNQKDIDTSIDTLSKSTDTKTRSEFKIQSPSQVWQEYGKYLDEGLANGLTNSTSTVTSAVSKVADAANKEMQKKQLKLNINTSVESSFNTILTKLQKFCNKWTDGINDLMKETKSSMNSMKISKDNKVSYSSMSNVKVSKFASGGMPTIGDLFYANENGKAEYVASLGNKTAVANQDQMAAVITNAVIAGFDKMQPHTTSSNDAKTIAVYIGNDKVYQGQGQYQNRQADRYGTTSTIKI